MPISIPEPYDKWLKSQLPVNSDENTLFSINVAVAGPEGQKDLEVKLDLTWFVILYVEGSEELKIKTALALLQNPVLLDRFKRTQDEPSVKRMLAEFLLFNMLYIEQLKDFIDFGKLNVPLDFISHALFIKRSEKSDTRDISALRLKIVTIVLDTGFKLPTSLPPNSQGAVLRKVLLMDVEDYKFAIARRLIAAGYKLFNFTLGGNSEEAIALIDARSNSDAKAIIAENKPAFSQVKVRVAGANGESSNLADYYFWVKEDMETVKYLKETFGIELSPTT